MGADAKILGAPRPASERFPSHHHWDRAYHLVWVSLAWAAIIAGFGPEFYHQIREGEQHKSVVLSIHASVFTAWLFLISLQIGLVRWKKVRTHMRLGMLGAPLGVAVVLSGVAVAASASRAAFERTQDLGSLQFFFHQLMDMAVFAVFFTAAMLSRKSAATHKRLIVLATTFLLGAGFSRAVGPWIGPWFESPSPSVQSAGYFVTAYGGINLLMAMAVLYDRWTRKRTHPANVWGPAAILCCEVISMCVVRHVPAWGGVAHRLLYLWG